MLRMRKTYLGDVVDDLKVVQQRHTKYPRFFDSWNEGEVGWKEGVFNGEIGEGDLGSVWWYIRESE